MDRIDKYKRVEEDQQQGRGKAKVIPHEKRDFKSKRFNTVRPRKDYVGLLRPINAQVVSVVFWEPEHWVLEKIKNEPFFKWPNKMAETLVGETRASIANTIKTRDILRKSVRICGII